MKRGICVLLIAWILLSVSQASAKSVPHPLSSCDLYQYEGTLEEIENSLRDKYTVRIQSENPKSTYPWSTLSEATLWTKEVAEAWVNRYSKHQLYTDKQRSSLLAEQFSDLEKYVRVQLYLRSAADQGYRYTELDRYSTENSRVVLETDAGKLVDSVHIYSSESDLVMSTWYTSNSVDFPLYDETGSPYISPGTQWIRVWLITSSYRAFFQFDFEPLPADQLDQQYVSSASNKAVAEPVSGSGWRVTKSWSGKGTKETELFAVDAQEWRISWETTNENIAGIFQILVYDEKGSLVSVAANHLGVGSDTSYVHSGPGTYYLVVNSANLDWNVIVEEP